MLEVHSVIFAKVLPFEQCSRALLAQQLANELKAYLATLSETGSNQDNLRKILSNIRLAARSHERSLTARRQALRKPTNYVEALLQSLSEA